MGSLEVNIYVLKACIKTELLGVLFSANDTANYLRVVRFYKTLTLYKPLTCYMGVQLLRPDEGFWQFCWMNVCNSQITDGIQGRGSELFVESENRVCFVIPVCLVSILINRGIRNQFWLDCIDNIVRSDMGLQDNQVAFGCSVRNSWVFFLQSVWFESSDCEFDVFSISWFCWLSLSAWVPLGSSGHPLSTALLTLWWNS